MCAAAIRIKYENERGLSILPIGIYDGRMAGISAGCPEAGCHRLSDPYETVILCYLLVKNGNLYG
jgi:hypothetical protein